MYIPKVIEYNDISSNSIKLFWKIDNFKIENIDKEKLKFKVEIRKGNSNAQVYECSNYNCLIKNLNKMDNYEIRICSIYNNLIGLWSDIFKVKTDFISETKILNKDDKIKLLNWLKPLAHGKNIYLKLIYRRGEDMSFDTFHLKCGKMGPTIVICQVKNEKFGGYANINWESPNNFINKYEDGLLSFQLIKKNIIIAIKRNIQFICL